MWIMYLMQRQWGGGINSCVRLGLVEVKDTFCMPREWMSVKCLYSCSEDYYYHEATQL